MHNALPVLASCCIANAQPSPSEVPNGDLPIVLAPAAIALDTTSAVCVPAV